MTLQKTNNVHLIHIMRVSIYTQHIWATHKQPVGNSLKAFFAKPFHLGLTRQLGKHLILSIKYNDVTAVMRYNLDWSLVF